MLRKNLLGILFNSFLFFTLLIKLSYYLYAPFFSVLLGHITQLIVIVWSNLSKFALNLVNSVSLKLVTMLGIL